MRFVKGYQVIVRRGQRAGKVYDYTAQQGTAASRMADRIDQEYGAIAASKVIIWGVIEEAADIASYRVSAMAIQAEHEAEFPWANAQGFARSSSQVEP